METFYCQDQVSVHYQHFYWEKIQHHWLYSLQSLETFSWVQKNVKTLLLMCFAQPKMEEILLRGGEIKAM